MRNCPLCGQTPHFGMPQLVPLADGRWSYAHHCSEKATIFIVADTKEEIREIWEGNHGEKHSSKRERVLRHRLNR